MRTTAVGLRGQAITRMRTARKKSVRLEALFADEELSKAVPYGVYDVAANEALVSVGITADTAEFAVAAIVRGASAWAFSAIRACAS
jgi:hypothetical protein